MSYCYKVKFDFITHLLVTEVLDKNENLLMSYTIH